MDPNRAEPASSNHERYSRQILFAPLGAEGQRRLAHASIVIVGCGALGSVQAELLARAGVGRLRLIDRDFVEASNLQRQSLFEEEDARQALPKAVAAAARLRRVNSSIAIESMVADLVPENLELLDGADLLLDGTDNAETRYLINDHAVARQTPWIYGAAVASSGVTFTVVPGETACLTCLFGDDDPSAATTETCDTAGVLAWLVSMVAALQVSEAVKLLTGARTRLRRSLLTLDVWNNAWRELDAPARDPGCRTCGRRDFVHLRGGERAAVRLCGRNAVQIHQLHRHFDLEAAAERLRPHGEVKSNGFALRFVPYGAAAEVAMTVFPDGRALIQGTTDTGLARSLYARYFGS